MTLPLAAVFADLPDPRWETANTLHTLTDILVVATCAVIAGCDTWDDIAEYGDTSTVPALGQRHPQCRHVQSGVRQIEPDPIRRGVRAVDGAACEASGLVPVAIDGKAARSDPVATAAHRRLTVVSAWATENRLTLGHVVVPDGTNEIAVIPELLPVLELREAIVTLDAAGCQVEHANLIRERNGHSLLAVKGNQPTL